MGRRRVKSLTAYLDEEVFKMLQVSIWVNMRFLSGPGFYLVPVSQCLENESDRITHSP